MILQKKFIDNFKFNISKENEINNYIFNKYKQKTNIKKLLKIKSNIVDKLVKKSWKYNNLKKTDICLIATGGYGRRELFPFSDIDILILLKNYNDKKMLINIEKFISDIWNLKASVGHAVRTNQDCLLEINKDVTVYTNLLDSRLITGDKKIYIEFLDMLENRSSWDENKFITAKIDEQKKRYQKYSNTSYLLEPSIKDGLGSFRDLHTILWIAKKKYNVKSLSELKKIKVITKNEFLALICSERFLSKVRFLLHKNHNKAEERLYFSNQKKLADNFGFIDKGNIGVEKFMQIFYKHIKNIKQQNDIFIKHIYQNTNNKSSNNKKIINDTFVLKNNTISVIDDSVFMLNPTKIFEILILKNKKNEFYDISANTIKLIRENLYLINANFRKDIKNKKLFISIFYQKKEISTCIRRMHDYGVLSAYLKPFSKIVGMMQFDLFHIYTVDEHTLSVLSNISFMTTLECKNKNLFVYQVFEHIISPEILYLSAIFHDIGKGRKKDHSKIGSSESLKFCQDHGISQFKSSVVSWLVENHLLMSLTVQKKDISDNYIIKEFADKVKTQESLDYLYLLTIADIKGTNPDLYTDWKDALLKKLYLSCKSYFKKNIFYINKPDNYIKNLKKSIEKKLFNKINNNDFKNLWLNLNTDYLRKHSEEEIAWHIELIIKNRHKNSLSIKENKRKGCTELVIYQKKRENIFSYIANIIDNLNINIVDARIISLKNNEALDTYSILDQNGSYIKDRYTLGFLREEINNLLLKKNYIIKNITKKQTQNISNFINYINVNIDKRDDLLLIEVNTLDHPGLLSKICESLDTCNLMVKDAKIATVGENANDIFTVIPLNKNLIKEDYINNVKNIINKKILELYN